MKLRFPRTLVPDGEDFILLVTTEEFAKLHARVGDTVRLRRHEGYLEARVLTSKRKKVPGVERE